MTHSTLYHLAALPNNHGIDQLYPRAGVDLLLEGGTLIEELLTQDTRTNTDVQDVIFEAKLGGLVRSTVPHNGSPCLGEFSFGNFGRDVGATEELFEQVAHQLGLGTSHRLFVLRDLRHPVANVVEGITSSCTIEDRLQTGRVAIGNEDLPKSVARYEVQQLLYATGIELVEEVIQQKDRTFMLLLGQNGVLCQFEGDEEGLLLPL